MPLLEFILCGNINCALTFRLFYYPAPQEAVNPVIFPICCGRKPWGALVFLLDVSMAGCWSGGSRPLALRASWFITQNHQGTLWKRDGTFNKSLAVDWMKHSVSHHCCFQPNCCFCRHNLNHAPIDAIMMPTWPN